VHDNVVASPQYKQVYALANDFAARAQQTWIVAKAKENLLPLAKPAVDSGVKGCCLGGSCVRQAIHPRIVGLHCLGAAWRDWCLRQVLML
jgi:hypothetical protein